MSSTDDSLHGKIKELNAEHLILSKLIYRNKNQHQRADYFKLLCLCKSKLRSLTESLDAYRKLKNNTKNVDMMNNIVNVRARFLCCIQKIGCVISQGYFLPFATVAFATVCHLAFITGKLLLEIASKCEKGIILPKYIVAGIASAKKGENASASNIDSIDLSSTSETIKQNDFGELVKRQHFDIDIDINFASPLESFNREQESQKLPKLTSGVNLTTLDHEIKKKTSLVHHAPDIFSNNDNRIKTKDTEPARQTKRSLSPSTRDIDDKTKKKRKKKKKRGKNAIDDIFGGF